jgi:hypothetical protein
MRKQHKYESKNAICRDAGHDWMTTAAANWRTCKRVNCAASERLVEGQWISNAKLYRQHTPVVASGTRQCQPRQSSMWETGRTGR